MSSYSTILLLIRGGRKPAVVTFTVIFPPTPGSLSTLALPSLPPLCSFAPSDMFSSFLSFLLKAHSFLSSSLSWSTVTLIRFLSTSKALSSSYELQSLQLCRANGTRVLPFHKSEVHFVARLH